MRFQNNRRNREPEWMDDPNIERSVLKDAVADINTCNRWLGGYLFTKKAVKKLMRSHPQDHYKIIDFGCSDGAMLRYLSDQFPDQNLEFLGVDLSKLSIEDARDKSIDYEEVRFRESDIFKTPLQDLQCDILLVTLTLHHFAEEDIPKFLEQFQQMARLGIIINDLHRSPIAYGFFKFLSPIFIRNKISIHDGLISIASGFKRTDFMRYAKLMNFKNDLIEWKWSFRYIWMIPTHERKN